MQLIWIVFLFVYYYYGMIRVIKCCTMLLLRQVVLNCSKLFWLELDDRCDHVNVLHFSVGVGHGIFPCPWILFFPFKVALLNKTWKAKISITLPKNIWPPRPVWWGDFSLIGIFIQETIDQQLLQKYSIFPNGPNYSETCKSYWFPKGHETTLRTLNDVQILLHIVSN